MNKGSSPAGQTQTVNPTAAAQLPFLQSGWQSAQNLYNANPMPSPYLTGAYSSLFNAGTGLSDTLQPQTNAAFGNAITGGMGLQNSPATPYFNQFATGANPAQQTLAGYGAQAAAGGGPGLDELAKAASGAYVGQNPYAAAALQAAQDATTRGYQTATAPQTDANFAGAGRYGSGALLGARGQNEQNLGTTLANQSNQFYNTQYQQERQLQDQAAAQYGLLRNQGLGIGINATGANLSSQQAAANALQSGYQSGNAATLNALQLAPNVQQLQMLPAQTQINAALGQQNAPYDLLGKYLSAVGQPTGPSGSQNQPYFQNPTANALSALTGVAGLGNTLAGPGGLAGLFGSSAAPVAATATDAAGLAVPLGAEAAIDAGGISGLAAAAPVAAWIVCTELKRQGRMPAKHWAVGIALFAGYPERTKRGYYLWAIPTVRHLRAHPNSRFSRFICAISCWRAENIAARRGVRGARWRLRGALVTGIGYPLCAVLGYVVSPQDWVSVYRQEEAAR